MNIIHENCDPKLAEYRKLPYTAYLVQYEVDGKVQHDIAMGSQAVELFDHYYDKYKKNFKWLKQSEGRVKPQQWNTTPTPPRKKRKRRKPDADSE